MARIVFVLFLGLVVARGQDQASPAPAGSPSPAPAPSVSATPAASPEASPAPASAPAPSASITPDSASAPEAAPSPAFSPEAVASPTPDVIPLDGKSEAKPDTAKSDATSGAPLDTQPLAPAPPEPPADTTMPDASFTDPNAIVPDQSAPPAAPQTVDNLKEKARLENIVYQEVRVKADKDPQVAAMFEKSTKAKTLEDERAALRAYYRLLFAKMVSLDKSLESKCKVMEQAYLRRLAQQRLEPTIPLNPPPTPEPLSH